MKKKAIYRHLIFARFLMPYLILLLIAALVGLVTYNRTVKVLEEEVVRSNMSLLEQSKDVLDRKISEINAVVQKMALDEKVMQFQYVEAPFVGATLYKVLETKEKIKYYDLFNNFVADYYLLFTKSDLAISAHWISTLPDFYRDVLYDAQTDYGTWYADMLGKYRHNELLPAREASLDGQKRSMLLYVQSLGYRNHFLGAIVVLIDHNEIRSLLGGLNLSQDGWAYIADENGTIISSMSGSGTEVGSAVLSFDSPLGVSEQTIGSERMIITHTKSSYNGWSYVAAQPSYVVLEKVNYIRRITLYVIFAALFFGLVIAYYMANRNSKPLQSILSTIADKSEADLPSAGGIFGFIHRMIISLIDKNNNLEIKMREQAPLLRVSLFERLLRGELKTDKEIETLFQHAGVPVTGALYAVAILHITDFRTILEFDTLDKLDKTRFIIKEMVADIVRDKGYLHDIEEDKIAFLLAGNSASKETFNRNMIGLVGAIKEALSGSTGIHPVFAIGGVYEQRMHISRSFEEAKEALYYSTGKAKEEIVWYEELPKDNKSYYYPVDTESRLINLVKAGEEEEVRKLLQELHLENFMKRSLSYPMLRLFLLNMLGSLAKLAQSGNVDAAETQESVHQLTNYMLNQDLDETFQYISDTFCKLSYAIATRKMSHNVSLKDAVIEFINAHYARFDLSLAAIAGHFRISDVYLSQFFKQQIGENLSDYLENVRMKRAETLLLTTNMTVNEIAAQVGYSIPNTFYRAFKRRHGMSTTVYRETFGANPFHS